MTAPSMEGRGGARIRLSGASLPLSHSLTTIAIVVRYQVQFSQDDLDSRRFTLLSFTVSS